MAWREAKRLKALYFDLRIKDLKERYSQTNPKGAYALIQRFLTAHNSSHSILATTPSTGPPTWKSSI